MGGAVSLIPDATVKASVFALSDDLKAMDKLFYEIAGKGDAGRINCKTKISLPNLLNYFKENPDLSLISISKNQNVLIEAHKYTGLALKNDSYFKGDQLSKKQFRLLIVTMYLFSHIWEIFQIFDGDVGDKRLSEAEFVAGKGAMGGVQGCEFIEEVSAEKWAGEFRILDKDKNGFITFDEFCLYTVTYIVKPETFIFGDIEDETEDIENMVLGAFKVESALEAVERMEREAEAAADPGPAPLYYNKTIPEHYEKVTEEELKRTVADEIAHLMRKIHKAPVAAEVILDENASNAVGGTQGPVITSRLDLHDDYTKTVIVPERTVI
jgi:hypothetical protein